jgi:hypothetical protein
MRFFKRLHSAIIFLAMWIGISIIWIGRLFLRLLEIELPEKRFSPKMQDAWMTQCWWCLFVIAWGILGLNIEPQPAIAGCLFLAAVTGVTLLISPWLKLPKKLRHLADKIAWSSFVAAFLISGIAWMNPNSPALHTAFLGAASLCQGLTTLMIAPVAYRRQLSLDARVL